MLEAAVDLLIVTDLKQYAYCPRIFYYNHCLPDVRPTTYKMEAGAEAGLEEKERARRRSLHAYHLDGIDGHRRFDVPATSETLGLTGVVDEVVEVTAPKAELIPVDYKLARQPGYHFRLQLAAYALLLEETYHLPVRRGFIYLIPLRRVEEVPISARLRRKIAALLHQMRLIAQTERMPPPNEWPSRCADCEFRRFCNDV
ncbi:MAG TPA: CRISPR-associated protein Cas4 [Anaerolineae bacterium]|nr:CRISPR-associated protein Cas4 [Anaerolineae bacterium]HUX77620.1 CRISPR-associated protein Cas4 [Anaerolineae bacterium]